jgi:hypothetical protein
MFFRVRLLPLAAAIAAVAMPVLADENLFGYVKGSETLPEGAWEGYQTFTQRKDKGTQRGNPDRANAGSGKYEALDSTTEIEYGVTNKFTVSGGIKAMSIDVEGYQIDGYLPGDRKFDFKFSGFEASMKYNFLSPALDDFGLSGYWSLDYLTVDPHSGRDKKTVSIESMLLAQKYFLEGQLIWVGNLGMEGTYAKRDEIDDLPEDFEWPTDPEMEIEFKIGTGLSYRFAPGWFAGAETMYETEFETEVGQERWSVFAGPNMHYASEKWWATLTWFKQIDGGGELIDEGDELHLIEKTKHEVRLKLGYNF